MHLKQLLAGVVDVDELGGDVDVEIAEVRDDSRLVGPGDLFVAVKGATSDGHDYLERAAAQGAAAVIVEREGIGRDRFAGARVRVRSSAQALAQVAAARFGRPADALTLIGVTGTNGKTTTTFLVEAMLRAEGAEPGVMGTVTYRHHDISRAAPFTTPTPLALHETLAEMRAAGCTHVVMETSSHALEQQRLFGLRFRVGAFTNLTQDHLDFHGTMERYFAAKARLFAEQLAPDGVGVILLDAEHGPAMAKTVRGRLLTVGTLREDAMVRVIQSAHSIAGISAVFATPRGNFELKSPLIGGFNLENLAVAVGIGEALGLSHAAIARGLASVRGVPGRLERVADGRDRGFAVFVDYAHTPDALERVMMAVRPLVRGRLLVVFGCGGDRDRSKRPKMGFAVARDADLAIVTSDNPRTEDPDAIIGMILDGVRKDVKCPALELAALPTALRGWVALADRRAAIGAAIAAARIGDVVLIAGKGHEDYQILGTTKHPFDDREEAAAALHKLDSARAREQN